MKIHIDHLQRFIQNKINKNELSNLLFQLGHEHEHHNGIYDIDLTPNRGDCLSLNGISRDLNFHLDQKQNLDIYQDEIGKLNFNFINDAPELCPKISFLLIEISNEINPYSGYLEGYFKDLNNKKINFFTDVSNFLLYELGQPTHCYEFSEISEGLRLHLLSEKSEFITLNNNKIQLQPNDLVFSSNDQVVNLAGIMGGNNSKCSSNTNIALVECAHFLPSAIIGKSIKYDISSEASHRFERFVDPNLQEIAIRRFIKIVSDHTKIINIKALNSSNWDYEQKKIPFNSNDVNKILGTSISDEFMFDGLKCLGFNKKDNFISPPSYRNDVDNLNDLAEEIARLYSYDNIPAVNIDLPVKKLLPSTEDKLRHFLLANGFNEVINSQFTDQKSEVSIGIDNPLDITRGNIRYTLESSLIQNLIFNEKRQKDIIKLFEVSDIYSKDSKNNIICSKQVGIIASGIIAKNFRDFSKRIDENFLRSIFLKIGFKLDKFIKMIDRNKIDSKAKTDIFFIEIPLSEIEASIESYSHSYIPKNEFISYKKVSEFPSSKRDFSFLLKNPEKLSTVSKIINDSRLRNIKDLFLFDFYKNENNNEIKVAYRFIFQSIEKTLTDEEINCEMKPLLEKILKQEGVSIPGYNLDEN